MTPDTGSACAPSSACPHLAAYDPLAPDELSDPYPTYAAARSATPAFRSERFGLWFISRYEDVVAATRDTETFSSEFTGSSLADFVPAPRGEEVTQLRNAGLPDDSRFLLTTDPPAHHIRRKLAQQAFTPRRVAALEPLIVDRTEELCDAIAGDGLIEVMGAFAYPLTTTVIAGILGVGEQVAGQMRQVAEDLLVINSPGHRELDDTAAQDVIQRLQRISTLHRALAGELAARRQTRVDDLLSAMAHTELADGTRLADEDILAISAELILAGTDTTANLIAHALIYATEDRELWVRIGENAQTAKAVTEETLRRRGSSKGLFRVTTRDVDVSGVTIPSGSVVQLLYGSANHDESRFPDPRTFILDRPGIEQHVAFGRGTHFCLGAPLARLETQVALGALSRRFPQLRVAPGQEITYLPALSTHTIAALQVLTA
jgi:cytochrome P450